MARRSLFWWGYWWVGAGLGVVVAVAGALPAVAADTSCAEPLVIAFEGALPAEYGVPDSYRFGTYADYGYEAMVAELAPGSPLSGELVIQPSAQVVSGVGVRVSVTIGRVTFATPSFFDGTSVFELAGSSGKLTLDGGLPTVTVVGTIRSYEAVPAEVLAPFGFEYPPTFEARLYGDADWFPSANTFPSSLQLAQMMANPLQLVLSQRGGTVVQDPLHPDQFSFFTDWRAQFNVACEQWHVVSGPLKGDMNCDGVLDFFDIDLFVTAVLAGDGQADPLPAAQMARADMDNDGAVRFFDIDPFVTALLGD